MKSITLIVTFLFSTTIWSYKSFADWTYVATGETTGVESYIDFERIRKHDGFVYFWLLEDLSKPDQDGDLSYINYFRVDCGLFRYKHISGSYYKQAMGTGTSRNVGGQESQWYYPLPKSLHEEYLRLVCGM